MKQLLDSNGRISLLKLTSLSSAPVHAVKHIASDKVSVRIIMRILRVCNCCEGIAVQVGDAEAETGAVRCRAEKYSLSERYLRIRNERPSVRTIILRLEVLVEECDSSVLDFLFDFLRRSTEPVVGSFNGH